MLIDASSQYLILPVDIRHSAILDPAWHSGSKVATISSMSQPTGYPVAKLRRASKLIPMLGKSVGARVLARFVKVTLWLQSEVHSKTCSKWSAEHHWTSFRNRVAGLEGLYASAFKPWLDVLAQDINDCAVIGAADPVKGQVLHPIRLWEERETLVWIIGSSFWGEV